MYIIYSWYNFIDDILDRLPLQASNINQERHDDPKLDQGPIFISSGSYDISDKISKLVRKLQSWLIENG